METLECDYVPSKNEITLLNGYSVYLISYEYDCSDNGVEKHKAFSEIIITDSVSKIFNKHIHASGITKIEKIPGRILIYEPTINQDNSSGGSTKNIRCANYPTKYL